MPTQDFIAQFRAQLRGELIEPGDAAYEDARKVYNGMISRKPRLIAKCVDVAEVIAAVKFGRAQSVRVSIRGGGHNAGGLGVADDGGPFSEQPTIHPQRALRHSRWYFRALRPVWSRREYIIEANNDVRAGSAYSITDGIVSSTFGER